MRALFAAVKLGVAFGANAGKFNIRWKSGGAIEAARRRHVLYQARQAGAGNVDGEAGTLRLRAVVAEALALAIRVHVPVLPVLAVIVHGESAPC